MDHESDFQKDLEEVQSVLKEDAEIVKKCPQNEREKFDSDPGWKALEKRFVEIQTAFEKSKPPTQTFLDAAKVASENLVILTKGVDHVKSYLPSVEVNDEGIGA